MKKSIVMRSLIFALVLAGCSQWAAAAEPSKDAFPTKPIELVVPFPAGGTMDAMGRIIARVMPKYLPHNQSVVVVNVSGASGIVGVTSVYNAKPDGYRIGLASYTTFSLHPHYGRTTFSHNGLQQLGRVANFLQVMFVRTDAPWKTFEDWLAYVKQNPDKFTYGIPGVGSVLHITMEMVNQKAGIKTKAVPFQGGAAQMTALMGGHIQGAISGVGDAKSFLASGELRPLFNAGSYRDEYTQKAPLLTEKGIDVSVDISFSTVAPKGMPADVLRALTDAIRKSIGDPQLIEEFKKIGLRAGYDSPEHSQKDIDANYAMTGEILRKLGLIK